MVKRYNKLVRDRIPQIIQAQGKSCVTKMLNPEEYKHALRQKLQEELDEYLESESLEELADMLEVMMAAAKVSGHAWQEIEDIRMQKLQQRGGFDGCIALLEVSD